jgi:hypothetical protein
MLMVPVLEPDDVWLDVGVVLIVGTCDDVGSAVSLLTYDWLAVAERESDETEGESVLL